MGTWVWGTLFSYVCWRIWKWKKNFCFPGKIGTVENKLTRIYRGLHEWGNAIDGGRTKSRVESSLRFGEAKRPISEVKTSIGAADNQI